MQRQLTEAGHRGLVDVGTCNIHVVHNAFHAAVSEYAADVNDLAVDLHTFFKLSTARREDFRDVQLDLELEDQLFVRHVPSRVLTFGAAVSVSCNSGLQYVRTSKRCSRRMRGSNQRVLLTAE